MVIKYNLAIKLFLRAYHLKSSGLGARCTALVLREDVYFGSCGKDCVVMVPTR